MKLVAGLGNPGCKYRNNRHNFGFMALDCFAKENSLIFKKKKLYEYVKTGDCLLIKPRTFMNRSGVAFSSVLASYPIDQILVVYDDVDLDFGDIRFRHKGSAGGHNGLKSITFHLGSNEYKRLRFGIGAPAVNQDMAEYVLADFSQSESKFLPDGLAYCASLLKVFQDSDFDGLLDFHSKNKKTYSEKLNVFQDH